MRRTYAFSTAMLFALTSVACGGGEPAEEGGSEMEQPAAETGGGQAGGQMGGGEMQTPEWFQVDHDAQTVTMDIVAGKTSDLNHWNFNGATNGNMTITVPEGYEVTINFSNDDPNMAHSMGIEESQATWSAALQPSPAFDGAVSSNPTSMTEATMPGQSETITFTAGTAGEYALVCYVPGHAATGMWVNFNVVAGQEAGVSGTFQ